MSRPLGPMQIGAAFAQDVTGDGMPDAIFWLTARGERNGVSDEETFLAESRTEDRARAYAALLVVDPMRRTTHTLTIQLSEQDRISGEDGTDRSETYTWTCAVPPPLPWATDFVLGCRDGGRRDDALDKVHEQFGRTFTMTFVRRSHGAQHFRWAACQR